MLEAKAKDQGHKRKCSPKKKKGLHKNFSGDLQIFQAISTKKGFPKNFSSAPQNFNNSKNSAVLKPIFEDRPIFEDLRPRGQGQGLQNVSSRPRMSSRTPPLLVIAEWTLFASTSISFFDEGTGTGGKICSFNFYSSSSTYLFQHVRRTFRNISKHFSLVLDSAFNQEPNIHVIWQR